MSGSEHFYRKNELLEIFEACLNKTLGEVDVNNVFDRAKKNPKITGIAGDVIEQSVLGYPPDNKQHPDLNIDGIQTELKTTGIRISKTSLSKYEAKEPMSITAVSPNSIVSESFEESKFWHKLEHMLLVYYLYSSNATVPAAAYADFCIKGYEFHEFSEEEKIALCSDWLIVRDFIIELRSKYEDYENQYPRISSELREKLFMIDTAPKWPNPPRFRLKRSVVTGIVQAHFGNSLEQLPGRYTKYSDIDGKCQEITAMFTGYSIQMLLSHFRIISKSESKSIGEQVIVRMFGGKATKMKNIEIFQKVGLLGKSITITSKGLKTEDMKLFCIDFSELTNPDAEFEDSAFREYFANIHLLCIVFQEPHRPESLKDNIFIGFKRIAFDDFFIENNVKSIWLQMRKLIFENTLRNVIEYDKEGKPEINKSGTIKSAPNFPKSASGVVFVRGSGTDSTNKPENINGISMYKQYLWLKGTYIASRLADVEYL